MADHRRCRNRPRSRRPGSRPRTDRLLRQRLRQTEAGMYLERIAERAYNGREILRSPHGQRVHEMTKRGVWTPDNYSILYAGLDIADYALLSAPELVIVKVTRQPGELHNLVQRVEDSKLREMYEICSPESKLYIAVYNPRSSEAIRI